MQAAEAAVAHDEHVIARVRRARQLARQRVHIGAAVATRSEPRQYRAGVPAEIRRRVQPHLVGAGERAGEGVAMHAHAHGVRARLEHRDDARRADAAAQAVDGGRDRRRMVRKVVVDAYAVDLAAQLHAARDAREFLQCIERARHLHPGVARGGDRGQRVLHVVCADQRPLDGAAHAAALRAPRSARNRPRPAARARSTVPRRAPARAKPSSGVQQPICERLLAGARRRRSRRCARRPARCAPGGGTGAGSRRGPGRCRRGRTRDC